MKSALTKECRPNVIVPYVRWMIDRDMPQVHEIERQSYENPWDEAMFFSVRNDRDCFGMVAELGQSIHGFMMYKLHCDGIRLLNIAVHPCSLRCRIAEAIVLKLISKLDVYRSRRITCEVRETNLRGQLFFRSMGFICTKTWKDFYEDSTEDAYVFEYRIPECQGK